MVIIKGTARSKAKKYYQV